MMNETEQREREPLAYDVTGFCKEVGISRSLFYDLQRNGEGPRVTKLGDRHRRSLILASDARTWLLQRSVTTAIDREGKATATAA
jgi:predicted DNA-binding transcriptional regulator AlpA